VEILEKKIHKTRAGGLGAFDSGQLERCVKGGREERYKDRCEGEGTERNSGEA